MMANKTDMELLEAAAKAAGIIGEWELDEAFMQERWYFNVQYDNQGMLTGFEWNPLLDDGHALRLAVKLVLEINICLSNVAVRTSCGHKIIVDADEVKDIYAATRRAIVRAAAEIGEQQRGER